MWPRHSRTRSRTIASPRPLSRASIVSSVSGLVAESPSDRLTSWRPVTSRARSTRTTTRPSRLPDHRGLRVAQQVGEDRGQRVVLDGEVDVELGERQRRRRPAAAGAAAPTPRRTRSTTTASRRPGGCAGPAAAARPAPPGAGRAGARRSPRTRRASAPSRATPRRARGRCVIAPSTGSRARARSVMPCPRRRLRQPVVHGRDHHRRRARLGHGGHDLFARRIGLGEQREQPGAVLEHVVAQLADRARHVGEQRRPPPQRPRQRVAAPAPAREQAQHHRHRREARGPGAAPAVAARVRVGAQRVRHPLLAARAPSSTQRSPSDALPAASSSARSVRASAPGAIALRLGQPRQRPLGGADASPPPPPPARAGSLA